MIKSLVVTARKTEERLQQVPISLTAFSGADLDRNNQRRIDDLPNRVPNLLFDQGIGLANTPRESLRGLSTNQTSPAADPVIGVYVDGVYRARTQGSFISLYDIERVEVLRGPQGALFGKNTVGGAINITTKQPEFDFGGKAEVRGGNFDTIESRFALNVPLVPEKAAVRVSLASATRDGYFTNQVNGSKFADRKLLGGRLQFLFLPREDIEIQLAFEQSRERQRGLGVKCVLIGKGTGQPGAIANDPTIGFRKACADDQKRSAFKFASDLPFEGDSLSAMGTSARVTWDITPDLTFTSITAIRRQVDKNTTNFDGTQIPLVQFQDNAGRESNAQWSQEFQLTGVTAGGRLRYVAGLFAIDEDSSRSELFGLGFEPSTNDITGAIKFVPVNAFTRNRVTVDNDGFAIYGQGTYSLTERLDLTVGARLTKDTKRLELDTRLTKCRPGISGAALAACMARLGQSPTGPNGFTGFDGEGRFGKITPNATLAYAFSSKALTYLSYATGFESGGFDGRAQSVADTRELPDQENTTYEFGVKSTWFNDRVILNADYFYNVLSDGTRVTVPRLSPNGQVAQGQNLSARATVQGAEIELGVQPLAGLQLRGNLGTQRSRIDSFTAGKAAGLNNRNLPITPNYTMNYVIDYERALGGIGTLGLDTSWSVRGKQNPVIQSSKQLQVNQYGLLDGRLSLRLPGDRTEIAAFGTNLLDRRYFYSGFSAQDTFGFGLRFFGPPRFYGLEVRRDF
jgi:iron complex outermembrane receptor protein